MQHCCVLLKYLHEVPYIIIEAILEILFQWSVVSQMEPLVYLHPWLGYTAAYEMMVANWIYWIAGFIGRFVVHKEPRKGQDVGDENKGVHTQYLRVP